MTAKNVLGDVLQSCSQQPLTGFFRDGCCNTSRDDVGRHLICAVVTEEFLAFSTKMGNDLTVSSPLSGFPGLKVGDRWCLCIGRWLEACAAGVAPPIVLASTHEMTLRHVPLEILAAFALDAPPEMIN